MVPWQIILQGGKDRSPWYNNDIKQLFICDGVTTIGNNAFRGCSTFKRVDLPNTVNSIGNGAFYDSSLVYITIPDSVSIIGTQAFSLCSLTSVMLPDGLEKISASMFAGCDGAFTVYIPDTVTEIDTWAFSNCSKLTHIEIPASVVSFGTGIFKNCSMLKDISLYADANDIAIDVFPTGINYHVMASQLELYEEKYPNYSFIGDLHNHVFDQQNTSLGKFRRKPATCNTPEVYYYSCVCGAPGRETFEYGEPLGHSYGEWQKNDYENHKRVCNNNPTHVDFENHKWDNSEIIKEPTCVETGVIKYICTVCGETRMDIIPETGHTASDVVRENEIAATCITEGSFDSVIYCMTCGVELSRNTEVVEKIPHTFNQQVLSNEYLKSAATCTEPASYYYSCLCGEKGTETFEYGLPLGHVFNQKNFSKENLNTSESNDNKRVYYYSCQCGEKGNETFEAAVVNTWTSGSCSLTLFEDGALFIKGNGAMTNYNTGSTGMAPWLISNRNVIRYVFIGDGVKTIGNYAFDGCTSLESIDIPESVTRIGDYSFVNCSALDNVAIPTGVSSIGNGAFSGCSSLTSVDIPENVASINKYTFCGCSSLRSVGIPDRVTHIGERAFAGCSSIEHLEIPYSVTTIDQFAFEDWSASQNIHCHANPDYLTMDRYTFDTTKGVFHVNEAFLQKYQNRFANILNLSFVGDLECTQIIDDIYLKAAATCTEPAVYYYVCADCGAIDADTFEYGLPNGHTWNDGVVTTPATCTAEGVMTYTCTECGATRTESIATIPHTFDQQVISNDYLKSAATCTEPAVYYYSCTCGEKGTETFEYGLSTGHSYGDWTTYNDTQHKRVCENDSNHIEYADHTWDDGVITTSPTCTSEGVMTYSCTECGATRTESIAIISHTFDQQVISNDYLKSAATCTEPAMYYYSCTCGEKGTETFEYGLPTGHSYGDWTTYNDTQHKRVCENDSNHVEYADHTWGDGVVTVEPTYETDGVMTYTCTVCGETRTEVIDSIIPDEIVTKGESPYVIVENNIQNIQPRTSLETFLDKFVNEGTSLRLFKEDGTELNPDTEFVGTGCILKLFNGDTLVDSKVLVVTGDNNGDGKVTSGDVKKALNHTLGKTTLDGVYKLATDVDRNNMIKSGDVKKILNYSLGKISEF